MMMKKNAIMAKVRMPLTHQFFHLCQSRGRRKHQLKTPMHKLKGHGFFWDLRALSSVLSRFTLTEAPATCWQEQGHSTNASATTKLGRKIHLAYILKKVSGKKQTNKQKTKENVVPSASVSTWMVSTADYLKEKNTFFPTAGSYTVLPWIIMGITVTLCNDNNSYHKYALRNFMRTLHILTPSILNTLCFYRRRNRGTGWIAGKQ